MTAPTAVAGSRRAMLVTAATLEQQVARLLRKYSRHPEKVVIVRAQPVGDGFDQAAIADRPVRIVHCVSPLAVLEQVTGHVESGGEKMLVVLTSAEENELGAGLLSHAIRQRIFTVEPWRVIEDSFGVQHLDARLVAEGWIAEALLDAMPPGGWPPLSGNLLTRDGAIRALAVRRLGLDRIGVQPQNLDAAALLLWSADRELVEVFRQLREVERRGLTDWLGKNLGSTVDVLFPLVEAGNGADALALGLVCGAAWHPKAGNAAQRAQGGVLTYVAMARPSEIKPSDQAVREFADTSQRLVGWMLADSTDQKAIRQAHVALDRAEELLERFDATAIARHSLLLRSGLDARVESIGVALSAAIKNPRKADALAKAVADLRAHNLVHLHAHRLRRAEMAQRLIQWLASSAAPAVSGVGAAVNAHVDEWGWVDRARDDIWAGEDRNRTLQTAYRDLYALVRERRLALDAVFAAKLAEATSAGGDPGEILTVETVLPRVVAPVVAARNGLRRPVLFLVLDGMSAAVAAALGEELQENRWEEYDPYDGGEARRRAVVAALPTLTTVSRASLFAARLTTGGQDDERGAIESHPFWKGRSVRLFHKGHLHGAAGETLGEDLVQALGDETVTVAVVLNTIDDSLDKERAETVWGIDDIVGLRALLDHARYQGRAIIITSDHGHVLERGTRYRQATDLGSARHRSGATPVGDGEVELAGSRVVADDGQVVALWDPYKRYGPKKAGYHGGASLAEVTIPLLAFLPLGANAPAGWRALPTQEPPWWSLGGLRTPPRAAETIGPARRKTAGKPAKPVSGQGAFDLATEVTAARSSLVDELVETDLFKARHQSTPRKVPLDRIRAALAALLDAGDVLPLSVLSQRIGEPPVRASGFAATLGQILNVDNYPVLQVVDGGRNVRLDRQRLLEQFGLRE